MNRSHVSTRAFLSSVALACLLLAPGRAAAEDERVIVGIEGAVIFPVSTPQLDRLYPGATLSVATQFSLTNYLMPLLRLRGGFLAGQPQSDAGNGYLGSLMGGLRFRPRGIAHPEEPSRASCIWAEIDAGVAAWNHLVRPTFERSWRASLNV